MDGIGAFIRKRRKELGLSQREVAHRAGMDRGYLSQIENSTGKWPQKYVAGLANALQVTEVDLAMAAGMIPKVSSEYVEQVLGAMRSSVAHLDRYRRLVQGLRVTQHEDGLQVDATGLDENEWSDVREKLLRALDGGPEVLEAINADDPAFFMPFDFFLASAGAALRGDDVSARRVETDRENYVYSLTALAQLAERIEASEREGWIEAWEMFLDSDEVTKMRSALNAADTS